jgi:hypothetical protein
MVGEKIIKRTLNVRCVLCVMFICKRACVCAPVCACACVSPSFDLLAKYPLDINVWFEWSDTNVNV